MALKSFLFLDFPNFRRFLEAAHVHWHVVPSSIFKASSVSCVRSCFSSLLWDHSWGKASALPGFVRLDLAHPDNPGEPPHTEVLNVTLICKSLLQVRWSPVTQIRKEACWAAIILPATPGKQFSPTLGSEIKRFIMQIFSRACWKASLRQKQGEVSET